MIYRVNAGAQKYKLYQEIKINIKMLKMKSFSSLFVPTERSVHEQFGILYLFHYVLKKENKNITPIHLKEI